MGSFKEQLQSDTSIFINMDEFAEVVKLNEQEIAAVVTYSTQEKYAEKPSSIFQKAPQNHGFNVMMRYLTIYFRAMEYEGRIPRQSEYISCNGRRMKVTDSLTLEGITKLTCVADSMNTPMR